MEILILKLNHKVRGILGFSTPLLNCPKFWSRVSFLYGLTWGDVGDAIGADEPTIVTRNQSRLATTMLNQNEELDVEEEEFESSDEQDNLNLVELASEDEADADVEA